MPARGARSRKVQQKEVEKKEKKVTVGEKAPEPIYDDNDEFAERRPTPSTSNLRSGISRTLTVSSNNSHATSRSSSTQDGNGRPRLTPLPSDISEIPSARRGLASVSDTSSKNKGNAKYQTNGKQTKAHRGRGGGVPTKKDVAFSSVAPYLRSETAVAATQKTWVDFKIWERGRDRMRSYGGFELVKSFCIHVPLCAPIDTTG
jgi:hypothetical protein